VLPGSVGGEGAIDVAAAAAAAIMHARAFNHLELEALQRPLVVGFVQLLILFMALGVHHATHTASAGCKVMLHSTTASKKPISVLTCGLSSSQDRKYQLHVC
jgi:hypothetical protein